LRRTTTFEEGAGQVVTTPYGKFRVFEPRETLTGRGRGATPEQLQGEVFQRIGETTQPRRGRDFPFRIERKQELTPAELELRQPGAVQEGFVVPTTARPVSLIESTGQVSVRRAFMTSERAELAPTRVKLREDVTYPELFRGPETTFRRGGRVAVRERTQIPFKQDLQSIIDQSQARFTARQQAVARPKPTTRGRRVSGVLPFAGIRTQPVAVGKPTFKTSGLKVPTIGPVTVPRVSPTPTTTTQPQVPVSPLRTTTPTRTVPRTPTVRQPRMPEPVIPRALPRKKKETDKKKRGRKTGFEFYDVQNPLAGFEQVFKNVGGKR